MKYTNNQLAIAAYWLTAGRDGSVDQSEANAAWSKLGSSDEFYQSKDDWELVRGLYGNGNLDWDEIMSYISELPLMTRYHISAIICGAMKKTVANTSATDGWPAWWDFCRDTGIDMDSYNSWAKSR